VRAGAKAIGGSYDLVDKLGRRQARRWRRMLDRLKVQSNLCEDAAVAKIFARASR